MKNAVGDRPESWGRYPETQSEVRRPVWRSEPLPLPDDGRSVLAFGRGRSYGDSCLNDDNVLLVTDAMQRFIAFDAQTGVLRVEAGVTIDDVLRVCVPQGWFMPVTPGTKFVTIAGAIANDVHGKNHHDAGCLGSHVRCFELLRSDGSRRVCSLDEHADFFAATIGGLGLTGMITWAEIQLLQINNEWIDSESIKMDTLTDFFRFTEESHSIPYTVAWVDSVVSGKEFGRGLFLRGTHCGPGENARPIPGGLKAAVPFTFPSGVLNRLTIKAFNIAFRGKQREHHKAFVQHYEPFFYPLDAVHAWNRVYGTGGLLQYQCVIPHAGSEEVLRELISSFQGKTGSFLTVLKAFGDKPSPGMLSFPRPGITLNLDFAMMGQETLTLCDRLDDIVRDVGGALYPAKDARMPGDMFRLSFPEWERFLPFIDPRFSSSFWRRVTGDARRSESAPTSALSAAPPPKKRGGKHADKNGKAPSGAHV